MFVPGRGGQRRGEDTPPPRVSGGIMWRGTLRWAMHSCAVVEEVEDDIHGLLSLTGTVKCGWFRLLSQHSIDFQNTWMKFLVTKTLVIIILFNTNLAYKTGKWGGILSSVKGDTFCIRNPILLMLHSFTQSLGVLGHACHLSFLSVPPCGLCRCGWGERPCWLCGGHRESSAVSAAEKLSGSALPPSS